MRLIVPQPTLPTPAKPNIISRDTPLITARVFHAQRHPNMVRYQNDWLDWDGAAYQMIEDKEIAAEIMRFLDKCKANVAYEVTDAAGNVSTKYKPAVFNPKDADVQQVLRMLEHNYHVKEGAMVPPFWLDGGKGVYEKLDPANLISCQNGLLDMTTRKLYPATPKFFTRTALDAKYDPAATCPQFLTFLFQVLDDEDLIRLMRQWFGYLITSDISIQSLLYMQGVPRSGKGTTARVIDALVGKRNVCSHTINDLAGNFGREGLIGKSLLKFTDMNTGVSWIALNQAVSIVNAITGQDPLHIERKFKGPLELDLIAHVIFIGNTYPDFGEHTAAIGERMKVIPFRRSFSVDERDPTLSKKLLTELSGILNFALDGLDDLRKSGDKFLICEKSEEAKRQILNSGNSVRAFGNDECELGSGFMITREGLFDLYVPYCYRIKANPLSANKFYTALKEAFPSVDETRPWVEGAERPRFFVGIRAREIGPPTTITKTFFLDVEAMAINAMTDDNNEPVILIDPITFEEVEVIENEF